MSKRFLTDRRGHQRCVFKFCDAQVLLTFPEDHSGPMAFRGVIAS